MLLESLKVIGKHFNRSDQTIRIWIKKRGFPAARLPNGNWAITESLIDQWLIEVGKAQRANRLS